MANEASVEQEIDVQKASTIAAIYYLGIAIRHLKKARWQDILWPLFGSDKMREEYVRKAIISLDKIDKELGKIKKFAEVARIKVALESIRGVLGKKDIEDNTLKLYRDTLSDLKKSLNRLLSLEEKAAQNLP